MRAGRLDRVVTLGKKTVSGQDSYGEETVTWTDVIVWAERRDLRGDERWTAQQVMGKQTCVYRIYYRTDLTVEDRLVDGSDTYDIHSIAEIGRKEGLELLCSARGEA